ncbi:MAG: EAL domain-containing protein, partial [Dyella sp.]|nr:EAL domain-containing protein [Dyella sp.]MBV8270643.1 EAL domain-containing protein [Cupriavidus sp.]
LVGAEVLLRWTHPELGEISPAEFVPIAEESGVIGQIGEWVLRTAVRQASSWVRQGLPKMTIAVNLSAVQFRQSNFPTLVERILKEEGLPPAYLDLELTEGTAMHDPAGAIAIMNRLREIGISLSIDDFGTGYSSLSYLKKFRLSKLKIDRAFVRDLSSNVEDRAIVSAVTHMARSLGLRTVAEGVETAEQLVVLAHCGCDELQGYFVSRPVTAGEFEKWVGERCARSGDWMALPEMAGNARVLTPK